MADNPEIDALGDTAALQEAATAGLPESARRAIENDRELREGQELRHFRIVGLLGKGAMGTVYHARDTSLRRDVALKVLPSEFTHDEAFIERFVREAQSQAMLSHPNVVPIYFVGDDAGRWFFAMEKVDGRSLDAILDAGDILDWHRALDVAEAVGSALLQAEERGLIHRDIKPSNILETLDGTFKLADFGIAKPTYEFDEQAKKLTRDGGFVGTPYYVAPEQARGEELDSRADIYALGATLFHLVAGKPPFEGDSLVAIVAKHASEPPPIDDLDVPRPFRQLLARALSKRPDERFDSWESLLEAVAAARPDHLVPAGSFARFGVNAIDSLFVFLPVLIAIPEVPLLAYGVFLRTAS